VRMNAVVYMRDDELLPVHVPAAHQQVQEGDRVGAP
jgi:hypothetical protein